MYSKSTFDYFKPARLLYPVTKKNYIDDGFIKSQWAMLDNFLSDKAVNRLTVFGYSVTASDVVETEERAKNNR